jgi:predicted anti-sigma-YlaC factor YlaD
LLTCKDFLGWLNEYLEETADCDTRKHLEEHVTACPNCWVVFDTTKKTLQVFKGMEPQDIPDEVEARLMEALRRRMESSPAP